MPLLERIQDATYHLFCNTLEVFDSMERIAINAGCSGKLGLLPSGGHPIGGAVGHVKMSPGYNRAPA